MTLQKNDFIEIEFIAKTKEGNLFDSNIPEELKKINPQAKAKPFLFPLNQGMFIQGVDDFLVGKDLGKYTIELQPENAFGKRDLKLIQVASSNMFKNQKVQPYPGAVFNFDNRLGKVLSVSGGRVRIDFNHPLAGKEVIYEVDVKRKIETLEEKVKALIDFFFRKEWDFKIQDNILNLNVEPKFKQFVELFKDKFKEILDLDLNVKELVEKPAELKQDEKK